MAVKKQPPSQAPAPPSAARRRRPQARVRSEGQIRRMIDHAAELGNRDLIFATSQAGVLRLKGLITDRHLATIDFIGQTYGRYEYFGGRLSRRRTHSPSYEFGTNRAEREAEVPECVDTPGDQRALSQYEEASQSACQAWMDLQIYFHAILGSAREARKQGRHGLAGTIARARSVIEALCVDNEPIPYWHLHDIVEFLDRLWIAMQRGSTLATDSMRRQSHVQPLRKSDPAWRADVPPAGIDEAELKKRSDRDHADLVRQLEARAAAAEKDKPK